MTTTQINTTGMDLEALRTHERAPSAPTIPENPTAVPPSHMQVPGEIPPPGTPPAGVDPAEYKEFLAYKAAQAAKAAAPTPPVKTAPQVPVNTSAELTEAAFMTEAARGHDPLLNSLLSVFDNGAKGLDRTRALGNALSRGDATLVDEAYIREVAGDNADSLINIAKSIVTHANAAIEEISSAVLASAGGQEAWDAATAAFNKSASPAMAAYVAAELNSGDKARIMSASALVLEQARSAGLVATPGRQIAAGGGGYGNAGTPLTKEEFKSERQKLNRRDPNFAAQERALMERRTRGAAQGL